MKAKSFRLWTQGRGRRVLLRADEGATLFEFAIVVPVLFMLLLGVFWMGRAYNVYASITRAAREGARYGASPTCASCGNAFPTSDQVQVVVNGALTAASLDPTNSTYTSSFTYTQGVLLNGVNPPPACPTPLSPTQECGVVVSFQYPVTLAIPFTSMNTTTINIPTSVQMRQEF